MAKVATREKLVFFARKLSSLSCMSFAFFCICQRIYIRHTHTQIRIYVRVEQEVSKTRDVRVFSVQLMVNVLTDRTLKATNPFTKSLTCKSCITVCVQLSICSSMNALQTNQCTCTLRFVVRIASTLSVNLAFAQNHKRIAYQTKLVLQQYAQNVLVICVLNTTSPISR